MKAFGEVEAYIEERGDVWRRWKCVVIRRVIKLRSLC